MKKHSELFVKIVKLDIAVSVHQHNLQYWMIKVYITKNSLYPSLTSEIFEAREVQYNL